MNKDKREKIAVIDLKALEEGLTLEDLKGMEFKHVLIPSYFLTELYNRASSGEEKAELSLKELKRIAEELDLKVVETTVEEYGDKVASIWKIALDREAEVITGDERLAEICEVMGVRAVLFKGRESSQLPFEKWLTPYPTSLHIKSGVPIQRKTGVPG